MENVEPVTCPECKRKYAPKFSACIYCKAPRPTATGATEAKATARPSPPPARPASTARPPATGSRPPAPGSRPPSPGGGTRATRRPVATVDDEAGAFPLGRIALAVVAAAGVAYAASLLLQRRDARHVDLVVVNASGGSGVSVTVDGKVVAELLPDTPTEVEGGAHHVRLEHGPHTLEARDAAGSVLETAEVHVGPDTGAVVFAPKHTATACFAIETAHYGTSEPAQIELLPPDRAAWVLPYKVDRWLAPNPEADKVQVADGKARHERALRLRPCGDGGPVPDRLLAGVASAASGLRLGATPTRDAGATPEPSP